MNLNRVELIGGVVRVPELRFTQGGYPHCEFTLAVNDTRYSKDEGKQVASTSFVSCQVWGPMAEIIANEELRKGESVYAFGQLDQSEWEDKEGKKQSKTRVKVAYIVRLEPSEGWSGSKTQDVAEPTFEPPPEEAPF